jgi:hypothetical protein
MTTVDHKARHVWASTPAGIRCAYMFCNARPEAAIAKLEMEEGQGRAMRREIRWTTGPGR